MHIHCSDISGAMFIALKLESGRQQAQSRAFEHGCFATRLTAALRMTALQVIGMPATFTVNPRTHIVDYIEVHPDFLSPAAFKQATTCFPSADIKIIIPAYLNEDHFQRALPLMPGILRVCSQS